MKICIAQTRPVKGDIQANTAAHTRLIQEAVSLGAEALFFPELSLTGYEPELAKDLATRPDDTRFDAFQHLSDTHSLTIGVGMPTTSPEGICISMLLFQPHHPREVYSKQYLHEDEFPYFVPGNQQVYVTKASTKAGLAICYELSVPAHAEQVAQQGATVYIASVAKTKAGLDNAYKRLADIARTYAMPVLLSNCVGPSDNFISGGKSAIWSRQGVLQGQLDDTQEGVLMLDTDTEIFQIRTA